MAQLISHEKLLFRLFDFEGAGTDARAIGDDEYAQECEDVASIIRELLQSRLVGMTAEQRAEHDLKMKLFADHFKGGKRAH